jgi:hypothetical protein
METLIALRESDSHAAFMRKRNGEVSMDPIDQALLERGKHDDPRCTDVKAFTSSMFCLLRLANRHRELKTAIVEMVAYNILQDADFTLCGAATWCEKMFKYSPATMGMAAKCDKTADKICKNIRATITCFLGMAQSPVVTEKTEIDINFVTTRESHAKHSVAAQGIFFECFDTIRNGPGPTQCTVQQYVRSCMDAALRIQVIHGNSAGVKGATSEQGKNLYLVTAAPDQLAADQFDEYCKLHDNVTLCIQASFGSVKAGDVYKHPANLRALHEPRPDGKQRVYNEFAMTDKQSFMLAQDAIIDAWVKILTTARRRGIVVMWLSLDRKLRALYTRSEDIGEGDAQRRVLKTTETTKDAVLTKQVLEHVLVPAHSLLDQDAANLLVDTSKHGASFLADVEATLMLMCDPESMNMKRYQCTAVAKSNGTFDKVVFGESMEGETISCLAIEAQESEDGPWYVVEEAAAERNVAMHAALNHWIKGECSYQFDTVHHVLDTGGNDVDDEGAKYIAMSLAPKYTYRCMLEVTEGAEEPMDVCDSE